MREDVGEQAVLVDRRDRVPGERVGHQNFTAAVRDARRCGNSRMPARQDVVGADGDALAEHGAAGRRASRRRSARPAATTQSRSTQFVADLGALHDDRALDRRAARRP